MNKRPLSLFPQEDESVMTRGWFVGNNGSPSNADYARLPPTWILYHKTAPHFIIKPRTNLWSCIFLCLHPPVIVFVHFDITASHLLGNGFARRHFDVWFELVKNIALRLWRYEMQNFPQIQDQRVRNHQDVIDCWAFANPRGCFNDLGFIHTQLWQRSRFWPCGCIKKVTNIKRKWGCRQSLCQCPEKSKLALSKHSQRWGNIFLFKYDQLLLTINIILIFLCRTKSAK